VFGKEYLYLNAPEMKALVDNMDLRGTTVATSKVSSAPVGG
jgi:hypothetical protein